eukprot:5829916-Amphidinium_carterae.1
MVISDVHKVFAIVVRAYFDILLITLKWACCCRRPIRKRILALRALLVKIGAEEEGDDDVIFMDDHMTYREHPQRWPQGQDQIIQGYRPLVFIQRQGGQRALPATWAGRRRIVKRKTASFKVWYSPQQE